MKACTQTIGRRYKEDDGGSDPFLKDYFRILQSYAYRRLPYKTQVMPVTENSHITTRAAHTNEVISESGKIALALGLNASLCMAIAAGHDIGHPPYGHSGERILSKLGFKSFKHNVNSVVILQHIENKGKGQNLTFETLDGITKHARGKEKVENNIGLEEYNVVMLADKIYVFSDFEDAIKYGYISKDNIPDFAFKLGKTAEERKNIYIDAIISESKRKGRVSLTEGPAFEDFEVQKRFDFDEIYPTIDSEYNEEDLQRICNYIATEFPGVNPIHATSLLTDVETNYLVTLLRRSRKLSKDKITDCGVFELLPYLGDRKIDYWDPDLGWGEELMRPSALAKTP